MRKNIMKITTTSTNQWTTHIHNLYRLKIYLLFIYFFIPFSFLVWKSAERIRKKMLFLSLFCYIHVNVLEQWIHTNTNDQHHTAVKPRMVLLLLVGFFPLRFYIYIQKYMLEGRKDWYIHGLLYICVWSEDNAKCCICAMRDRHRVCVYLVWQSWHCVNTNSCLLYRVAVHNISPGLDVLTCDCKWFFFSSFHSFFLLWSIFANMWMRKANEKKNIHSIAECVYVFSARLWISHIHKISISHADHDFIIINVDWVQKHIFCILFFFF